MLQDFQLAYETDGLQGAITSTLGQIIIFALAIILLLTIVTISGSRKNSRFKVKELTYSAISLAIATVLSNIKLFELPQGGSVTLFSMLFVVIIGYLYGPAQGIITGLVYGLIQLALGGWVVHPVQLILEYPLAFSMLGLSGFFRNSNRGLIKGMIVGGLARFVCHFIAGIIFFAEYAPEGTSPVLYSFTYNIGYIAVEVILTIIILLIPAMDSALKTIKRNAINEN